MYSRKGTENASIYMWVKLGYFPSVMYAVCTSTFLLYSRYLYTYRNKSESIRKK